MSKKFVFIPILLTALSVPTFAQVVGSDLLALTLVTMDGKYASAPTSKITLNDTAILVDTVLEATLSSDTAINQDTLADFIPHPLCLPLMYDPWVAPSLNDTIEECQYTIEEIRRNALRYITTHHADLYVSVSDPTRLQKLELGKSKVHRAIEDDDLSRSKISRTLQKKSSAWRQGASVSLQITQNYATNNWYQGAVNAFTMLGGAKAYANYKKENISWENNAEWRVGVSTVSGDTLHKMKTTDDRLQVYSKFGYQVHKQWYVSMFADFKTNLFPNFQTNSNKMNATFMTPIRYNMGIGVDCKILKGLSINFSPATYKMVYALNIDPAKVNVTDFGIAENEHIVNEIGSSLRVEWKWKPLTEIKVETKFYFFTNYKQVETELEIDVDFFINKYMSAKIMLHPRYDGTVEDTSDKKSKLQFKEVISVGFAHTFR